MAHHHYDVVILGAGPAGEVMAGELAGGGLSVAIVEDRLVGGECSFWACMPSKALLRPGAALDEVRRVPGAAEAVSGELDVPAVLARRDEVIHGEDDSAQLPWLEEHGIALHRGYGRLDGERRVVVGEDTLEAARAVVVSTGSLPAVPGAIEGLAEARPWTNREITLAEAVPGRLLILGGGVVGAEMARAWRSLGSEVVVVERGGHLLPKEEPWASEQVCAALTASGVELHLGATATRAGRDGDRVWLELDDGERLEGDELLVALGRVPQTKGLGLDTVGLPDEGHLEVGDDMAVPGHPWLLAVGDVNGRALLTHMGKEQARIAAARLLHGEDVVAAPQTEGPLSPRVTFTEPQVAAVGHTEASAREAGLDVEVVQTSTSGNAGGSFWGHEAEGTAQLVVDRGRGIVVGATITGAEIQDMLHAATIAVVAEVPVATLRRATPAFPTRSEIWLQLLAKL